MRAALAILLVPAFAAAKPKWSTTISADPPFADGVVAMRGKLDACWRKAMSARMKVTVTAGAVTDIELVEVDPKAPLPCLTRAIRAIKLDPATTGVFDLTLRGDDLVELLAKTNVGTQILSGSGGGRGASNDIDRVIRQKAGVFRQCYQKELTRKPTLSGKVTVRFSIDANGNVKKAAIASTTMADVRVESCLRQNVMKLQFPTTIGVAEVTYPFVFAQGG